MKILSLLLIIAVKYSCQQTSACSSLAFPFYFGADDNGSWLTAIDIDTEGNLAIGGYSQSPSALGYQFPNSNSIVMFMQNTGFYRWAVFFTNFRQSVSAIKFNPDGTQVAVIFQNEPLTLVMFDSQSGTQYSYQENTGTKTRGQGFCAGECIHFSDDSTEIYLSMKSQSKTWEVLKLSQTSSGYSELYTVITQQTGQANTLLYQSSPVPSLIIGGFLTNPTDSNIPYLSLSSLDPSDGSVHWHYGSKLGLTAASITNYYVIRRVSYLDNMIHACSDYTGSSTAMSVGVHLFTLTDPTTLPTLYTQFFYGTSSQKYFCKALASQSSSLLYVNIFETVSQISQLVAVQVSGSGSFSGTISQMNMPPLFNNNFQGKFRQDFSLIYVGGAISNLLMAGYVYAFSSSNYSCYSQISTTFQSSDFLQMPSVTYQQLSFVTYITSYTYSFKASGLIMQDIGQTDLLSSLSCTKTPSVQVIPAIISDQYFIIGQPQKSFSFSNFIISGGACPFDTLAYTMSITPRLSIVNFDNTILILTLAQPSTGPVPKAKNYSVVITGQINSFYNTSSFTLVVASNCDQVKNFQGFQPAVLVSPNQSISPVVYLVGQPQVQVSIQSFTQNPSYCGYNITYSVFVFQQVNSSYISVSTQSFATFNPNTMSVIIYSTNLSQPSGLFIIGVNVSLNDYQHIYDDQLRFQLNLTSAANPTPTTKPKNSTNSTVHNNTAPYLVTNLSSVYKVIVGVPSQIIIPYAKDNQSDLIFYSWENPQPSYITINSSTLITVNASLAGNYSLYLTLFDNNPQSLSNKYLILIQAIIKSQPQPQPSQNLTNSTNVTINQKVQAPVIATDSNIKARIVSISANGLVLVQFNQEMLIPIYNYTYFYNLSILEVRVIPYDQGFYTRSSYIFTWEVTDVSSPFLSLQLTFDHPEYISLSYIQDILEIKFVHNEYFISQSSQQAIRLNYTISQGIPEQITSSEVTQSLNTVGSMLSTSIVAVTGSSMLLYYMFSSSFQFIWGLINSLQIIVHLPLVISQLPSNAHLFFLIIYNSANFNLLPTNKINQHLRIVNYNDYDLAPFNAEFLDMDIFQN